MSFDQIIKIGALVIGALNVYMLLYVGKVIGPIKAKLVEHDRLHGERRKGEIKLWEKTTEHGERLASVEAKVN